MELKQLEYFLAVSKAKSFTRAAEQLYISQPSVTSAIKKLEEELGLVLFDRSKRQVELTNEGEIFYSHICVVMQDISKAAAKAAELKNLSSGLIKIGITPLTCLSSVSFLMAKFRNMFPTLNFDFIEGRTDLLKAQLEENKIDLALMIDDESLGDLSFDPINHEELMVYLPVFHHLSGRERISFKELRQEIFILPRRDCSYRTILTRLFTAHRIKEHVSFETNYPQLIQNLVISGCGITILPRGAIDNNAIRAVPLKERPKYYLCVVKKKDRQIAHAAQKMYNFLKDSFAE